MMPMSCVPGAAQRGALQSGALQTRDRSSLWRSRISGAPLRAVRHQAAFGRRLRRRETAAMALHRIRDTNP